MRLETLHLHNEESAPDVIVNGIRIERTDSLTWFASSSCMSAYIEYISYGDARLIGVSLDILCYS